MAPRANWRGFLKIGELSCPVALYTAAATSERVAFHTLNRETGHRVRRQFVDPETGDVVGPEQQAKGYETAQGEYVLLDPEEVAAAVPKSDKTLDVETFVKCNEIDETYLDRPYYLAPGGPVAQETFALIREGLRREGVAAFARTVLFRRVRSVLIRPSDVGLVATTLHFDYEVRSAKEAFDPIPEIKIDGEMLDLAKHILSTMRGEFNPSETHDRYEEALAELVRAKIAGRPFKAPKAPAATKSGDLLAALRRSAGATADTKTPKRTAAKRTADNSIASQKSSSRSARRKAS